MERLLKSRYRIGEKISENPFSVTYGGYLLGIDKPVIIKIYKRGALHSSLINRMKNMVKEFAQIKHHGIAQMIDGDYGWQGFYYVREYIKGKSLHQIMLENQEIGLDKSLAITEEVCRALEAAHARGIIHGALKPSNIFIDAQGVVKVADFILEGEIKQAMPQKAELFLSDGMYASPEELIGQPASFTSDIYSTGLVLGEMLAHKRFIYERGLAGGLKKIRDKLELLGYLSDLPKSIQDIIGKALKADPLLRFPSAAELRESLEKRSLVIKSPPNEELAAIFDNTVTQYGGEELKEEDRNPEIIGEEKITWKKEKHRSWILIWLLLGLIIPAVAYVLFFTR